jgi:outer membrane protein
MKKILAISLLLMMIFSTHAMASQLKIGYANLQRALNESEAGKRAKTTLKAEAEKYRKLITTKEEKLLKLKTEIDKKLSVWNQETKEKKVKGFQTNLKEFQKTTRKYDTELKNKKAQTEAGIINELREIVKAIAKKKNYTFILESSAGAILHAPENVNITDELIKQYNKKTR